MNNIVSNPIFITLEEFENVVLKCRLQKISITPVLQIWDETFFDYYKATGYLIVSGICERDFWVASYSSEGLKQENIDYEKAKFLELIDLSILEPLVEKGMLDKMPTIADVIVR